MKLLIIFLLLATSIFATEESRIFVLKNTADKESASREAYVQDEYGHPIVWSVKWPITVSFQDTTPDFVRTAVMNSLKSWSAQASDVLKFEEISSGGKIKIIWNETVTDSKNVIAQTADVGVANEIIRSEITFYAASWKFHSGAPYGARYSSNEIDIEGVALHECGHALGLAHVKAGSSFTDGLPTMWPFLTSQSYWLHAYDVKSIRELYAAYIDEFTDVATEQDKMVVLLDKSGADYVLQYGAKLKAPKALRGTTANTITMMGKSCLFYDPVTRKFIGQSIGTRYTPRK